MLLFIGLNRIKKFQTATLSCVIPLCFGLNVLGHLSSEEVIYTSLMGNLLNILLLSKMLIILIFQVLV